MTPELLAQLLDCLARAAACLRGHPDTGHGAGNNTLSVEEDWGISLCARQFRTAVMSTMDFALMQDLLEVSGDFDKADADALIKAYFYQKVMRLSVPCRKFGYGLGQTDINDLPSYLSYVNTGAGGPYKCLAPPGFAAVYALLYSASLPPACIYAPPLTNLAQKSVGGLLLPGDSVDTGQFAGAGSMSVTVSSSAWTEPGLIIVSGKGRMGDGTVQEQRDWAVTAGGDGTFLLAAEIAGDLCITVERITLPPSLTAGTVIVSSGPPAGREAA